VVCWSTKAAISLKRVKIEEKLLWRAYRKWPTLFRTVPFPTSYASFPRLQVRNPRRPPPNKSLIAIIPGACKATDFKFGQYIHTVHPNKSPLEILEKREHGRIQGLRKFLIVLPIITGTGNATNFKFCTPIHRLKWNKSPLKIWDKVALVESGTPENYFQGNHIAYSAHREVIFAIAQLSCYYHILSSFYIHSMFIVSCYFMHNKLMIMMMMMSYI